MLSRLSLRDFALVGELVVEPGPGLNVFTGDTGAGKSILVNAVALLGGGRADTHWIRSGARNAFIEGVFDLPATHPVWPRLAELGIESGGGQLIVQREIWPGGRSQVRLNLRSVPLRALETIGPELVEVNGQNQQLQLLRPARQLLFLDDYAGSVELRRAYRRLFESHLSGREELERLGADSGARAREMDLLSYQIAEIEQAQLQPGEERQLMADLRRNSNLEELTELLEAVCGDLDGPGSASTRLGRALDGMARVRLLDPNAADLTAQLQAAQEIADQAAAELRGRLESLEPDPAAAEQMTARMRLLDDLKRKYGATIEDIAGFAAAGVRRLEQLQAAGVRIAAIESELADLRSGVLERAAQLRAARRRAAKRLQAAVVRNLSALGMAGARFEVAIDPRSDPPGSFADPDLGGLGPQGADAVRFDLAANPGEPLAPLARVASGGEISRIMLALRCALLQINSPAVIIFDEIDAGIGGRRGLAVGLQLWRLAARGQVFCVTHLPQIPAFAQRHFYVAKHERDGRSHVNVQTLSDSTQMDELAAMTGGAEAAAAAVQIKARADELIRQSPSTSGS